MEYYILEDEWNGERKIFKDEARGKEEMLRWYLDNGLDDIYHSLKDTFTKLYPDAPYKEKADEALKHTFEYIKEDLTNWLDNDYIESFAYLYPAEVIE